MEVAAIKLALSTLSPVIQKLGSYVFDSYFGGDVTAEEMSYLNDFVRFKIAAVIRAAELGHSGQLMPLLDKLQAAAFEAEDLLDLYEYKQIKNQQVSSSSSRIKKLAPKFMLIKSKLRNDYENLLKFVNHVEETRPSIELMVGLTQQNNKSTQASNSNPTTSRLLSPYFGRAKQIDNIIESLLDESLVDSTTRTERVPIISIKGLGGSGKTVTAQRIFKDVRVNAFNLKMWVHVARNFNVRTLTKEIIESTTKGSCDQIDNLDTLQTNLKECISGQKFLLVLDDMWCTDKAKWVDAAQWALLLSPLNDVGVNGSKIIITTRMEQIASILDAEDFPLGELKTEDCWSILRHHACINSEIEDLAFKNVGDQIISKVKSSPLALKIAGCSLKNKNKINEWDIFLKQDMLEETMDLLLFSFQQLPSHLQRCFAYCSLFPKGYQFTIFPYYHKEQHLIPLWIAQGYVENDKSDRTLEEIGSIYIEELISYSFFEKRSRSDDYFIIHDLLHDLAENVSKGRCHRIENRMSLNIPTTCIHLSISTSHVLEDTETLKFKKLRTLIIFDYGSGRIFENKKDIFLNLINLRALFVEKYFDKVVIRGPHLDELKHLRYLRVSFDKLPRSLTKLYHLQFYDSMGMKFCIGKALKNLPLCGSLSIVSLENIKNKEEVAVMMLNEKKNLNEIVLEWNNGLGIVNNSSTSEEVLDALEPPPSLESLEIRGYPGVNVASWMREENRFPRLQFLILVSCRRLKEFPSLPPRLVSLHVKECAKLTTLPMNLEKHTSLKYLDITGSIGIDDLNSLPNMPMSLKELTIVNCEKLTTLPMNLEMLRSLKMLMIYGCRCVESLPNLPKSLVHLYIHENPKLEVNYKVGGRLRHTISRIPHIHINTPLTFGLTLG